jgi:hypothetical protein
MLIPHICNQLIEFSAGIAGTKQPFQSSMSGKLSKKLTKIIASIVVIKTVAILVIMNVSK